MPSHHDLTPEELLARLRLAEEAVAARDDFLATAAHELRSPLNALGLRLEALERMAAAAGQVELGRQIARTHQTVNRYVRRAVVLLDVSRLNSEQQALTRSFVHVRDLVHQVAEDYRDEASFRGSRIEWAVEGDIVGYWDAHMIEQIMANLVSNGIRYGGGSPVTVRASAPESDPGWAVLEVEDRGAGIAEADRARIFGKFERAVASGRERAGFGLGLWIVGRMVAAHDGTIDVLVAPQGGTLFRIRLPLAPQSPRQEEERE